jgi:hypothetical protein
MLHQAEILVTSIVPIPKRVWQQVENRLGERNHIQRKILASGGRASARCMEIQAHQINNKSTQHGTFGRTYIDVFSTREHSMFSSYIYKMICSR